MIMIMITIIMIMTMIMIIIIINKYIYIYIYLCVSTYIYHGYIPRAASPRMNVENHSFFTVERGEDPECCAGKDKLG